MGQMSHLSFDTVGFTFTPTFWRNVLPPSLGLMALCYVEVHAEVLITKKYVDYLSKLQGIWSLGTTERGEILG
jgi:hypothetical protein